MHLALAPWGSTHRRPGSLRRPHLRAANSPLQCPHSAPTVPPQRPSMPHRRGALAADVWRCRRRGVEVRWRGSGRPRLEEAELEPHRLHVESTQLLAPAKRGRRSRSARPATGPEMATMLPEAMLPAATRPAATRPATTRPAVTAREQRRRCQRPARAVRGWTQGWAPGGRRAAKAAVDVALGRAATRLTSSSAVTSGTPVTSVTSVTARLTSSAPPAYLSRSR